MSLLDRDTVRLASQNKLIEICKTIGREQGLFGKDAGEYWDDAYKIYTGLLALTCENVLTEDEEQCVLGKLQKLC